MPTGVKINWELYDHIILKEVRETPENLRFAFTRVAEKTGLKYPTVQSRWYKVLSLRRSDYSFIVVSNKKTAVSRKNSYRRVFKREVKRTSNPGLEFVRSFIQSVKRHFSRLIL